MTGHDRDELRRQLQSRQRELTGLLERIRGNIGRGLDPDSKERAKELEDADVVDSLGNDAVEELGLIRATLERLETGEYGQCLECADPIGDERLAAYPYASLCIDCAREEEARAGRRG